MNNRIDMTRRGFLGSLAAVAAVGPGRVFAVPPGVFTAGTPNLTFGVLSDIHVQFDGRTLPLPRGKESVEVEIFRKALVHFRDVGADAVVLAGDMANCGLVTQLRKVAETWFSVFPDDRAPDGRKVERVFVFGNHDASVPMAKRYCKDDASLQANALALNPAKWWKEIFHEDFALVYRKTVRGYDFIGAHWSGNCRGTDDAFCPALEAFYDRVGPTLNPKKPFFHVQHPHPKHTVHGERVWGQDDGLSVKVLSRHPNAIAFSGHSHNSLLDERAIWQGAFTSVATATTYTGGWSALESGVACGFENGKTRGGKMAAEYDHVRVMPMMNRGEARQAQVVRVYDDRVVFSRIDLVAMKPLGDDLVLPLPAAESRPFAFEPRRAVAKAPAFPSGAAIAFAPCSATRRDAKKGEEPVPCLEVSVPAAIAEPSAKGVRYRIDVENERGEKLSLEVLHDALRFAGDDLRTKAPLRCPIALERLPKGRLKFAVTAFSWWDKPSATLSAAYENERAES